MSSHDGLQFAAAYEELNPNDHDHALGQFANDGDHHAQGLGGLVDQPAGEALVSGHDSDRGEEMNAQERRSGAVTELWRVGGAPGRVSASTSPGWQRLETRHGRPRQGPAVFDQ